MSGSAREILEARARALAAVPDEGPVRAQPYSVFRLRGQLCAARVEQVDGAGQLRELSPVPGAPEWVLGATLHRGAVLTLVDLPALWGAVEGGIRDLPAFVVVASGARRLGLLVEQLLGNLDVEGEPQPDAGPRRAGVIARLQVGDEPLLLLDAEALLADARLNP